MENIMDINIPIFLKDLAWFAGFAMFSVLIIYTEFREILFDIKSCLATISIVAVFNCLQMYWYGRVFPGDFSQVVLAMLLAVFLLSIIRIVAESWLTSIQNKKGK